MKNVMVVVVLALLNVVLAGMCPQSKANVFLHVNQMSMFMKLNVFAKYIQFYWLLICLVYLFIYFLL